MIIENKSSDVLSNQIKSSPLLIAYFYSDHCAPCISLRPKMEALIKESFNNVDLVFMNGEHHVEYLSSFQILSFPTLVLYADSKEVKRYSKYVSLPEVSRDLNRYQRLMES